MDACSRHEQIEKTDADFHAERIFGDDGNEVFRQYDEQGRLVLEATVAARPAETRVYDYADVLRGHA